MSGNADLPSNVLRSPRAASPSLENARSTPDPANTARLEDRLYSTLFGEIKDKTYYDFWHLGAKQRQNAPIPAIRPEPPTLAMN